MKRLTLLFGLLIALSACRDAYMTKEKYLDQYDQFVEDVRDRKDQLTEAEWQKLDAEHEHYSKTLYQKFKDELSTADNIHVKRNQLVYTGMRGLKGILDIFNEDVSEEINQSVDEVKKLLQALDSNMVE